MQRATLTSHSYHPGHREHEYRRARGKGDARLWKDEHDDDDDIQRDGHEREPRIERHLERPVEVGLQLTQPEESHEDEKIQCDDDEQTTTVPEGSPACVRPIALVACRHFLISATMIAFCTCNRFSASS